MKKLIFIIIILFYGISCRGQRISLSKSIDIRSPQRIVSLSKDQFSALGSNKFSHSKSALEIIKINSENSPNKTLYNVDNILITLVHSDIPVKQTYLEEKKQGNDAMNNEIKDFNHYASELKTVKNNHVFIMYHDWEKVGYYYFHCWNGNYTHAVTGSLQFDIADKDKAKKVLDDLLNGVEFTQ